jgi:hypothetical protein
MAAMASGSAPMRLRRLPLPELLDELFRLYRRYFGLIVGVALVVALPGLIWQLFTGTYKLSGSSFSNLFTTTPGSATPTFSSTQLSNLSAAYGLAGLGGLILLPFSVGAVYRAVTDVALGRPATIGSVLRETLSRYWQLFGFIALFFVLVVAWFIALLIGLIVLVLPGLAVLGFGVYVAIRWSMSLAAMMAENIGPIQGFSRSWNLVKGQWWRTFGVLLVVGILQLVISFALGALFGIVAAAVTTGDLRLATEAIGSTLLSTMVSPITTIAVVLLYFDLRVRKEGLDLDQLAQQTNQGPTAA